ncbi:MAG: hypothetical protein WC777_06000 [Candidatus Gracilibacteria bacterium]|jgi:hypothetical protein
MTHLSEVEARALYDRGLDKVLSAPGRNQEDERLLATMRSFKSRVLWVELQGDRLISVEGGTGIQGYKCIIPFEHRLFTTAQPIFVADRTDLNLLMMKAFPVEETWAGLLGVHEHRHLYDKAVGIEPKQSNAGSARSSAYYAGEGRAYATENAAADAYTEGEWRRVLEKTIQRHGITKAKKISNAVRKGAIKGVVDLQELESVITTKPAESEQEEVLRDGFSLMALTQYLLEKEGRKEDFPNHIQAMMERPRRR